VYELQLSYALGYEWAHATATHLPGSTERAALLQRAYPWLSDLAQVLLSPSKGNFHHTGTGTGTNDDALLDITSPTHGPGTRVLHLRLSSDVATPSFETRPPPAGDRRSTIIGDGPWPSLRTLLCVLQCVLPGMVRFVRTDVAPHRIYAPPEVDLAWMELHADQLCAVLGGRRYEEVYRGFRRERNRTEVMIASMLGH
jgi:hypothetical protein